MAAPADTGPELVLDQMGLYILIGDRDFSQSLPEGCADLVELAKQARDRVIASAMGTDCHGCSALSDAMIPFQNALGQKLAKFQPHNLQALEPLAKLIAKRHTVPPKRILMYYRAENGTIEKLQFS